VQIRLPILSQNRILGGAAVLALLQFGASLAGLLRDRLLARTFPGLDTVDVYIASFRPADLLFQVCIMAGFSVVLVPFLAAYRAQARRDEMDLLLSGVTGAAALVFGVLALAGALAFGRIAPLIVGFTGESLEFYITFGRLALLSNFLFVFGNAFGQYLITVQRYWVYGLTPILYTLGTIFGTVYLTPVAGAYGPIYGTLAGAVLYVLLRFAGALGAGYRPRFACWHPDVREMFVLMLPRMAALGALQLQLLLFDTIASGMDAGAVTVNAYARNFQSVVVGVAGIALAQSAFSPLSQAAARGEWERYWLTMRKGVHVLLAVTVPGAVALVAFSNVAAALVHLTDVLPLFSLSLALYAVSIPFESVNHLFLRAFYATKHTVTPAVAGVANGVLAIALSWFLTPVAGVAGLAIAFTAGQVAELLGLAVFLPRMVRKRG